MELRWESGLQNLHPLHQEIWSRHLSLAHLPLQGHALLLLAVPVTADAGLPQDLLATGDAELQRKLPNEVMLATETGAALALLVDRRLVDSGSDFYLPESGSSDLLILNFPILTLHEMNQARVDENVVCCENHLEQ